MRFALSQMDRSAGARGNRGEHLRVEGGCRVLQFFACGSRFIQIADRQHDVHVGGQVACALEPVTRRGNHAATGVCGSARVPFREPQQRQSRLRLEARAAGFLVSRCGEIEFTAQPMNLRGLVVSPARGLALYVAHAALNGALGFNDRFRPRAAHLEDFSSMDQAMSREHA